MPTWWPSTRSDGRVEGHSATDHRPHRGLERSAAVTAGEGRSTRNAGSFLLRPSRPWGRSARGQYLSSRCALEHAPGTVPFSGDDEERVPVSTSECACEAASVDFHGLLHLSAFLDAHASLVGDIRVPNGAAGIRADAFGEIANGWGGSHPVGVPVIVVSHTVPEGWPRPDRKVVFASGIEDALQQARKVAVDKTIASAAQGLRSSCSTVASWTAYASVSFRSSLVAGCASLTTSPQRLSMWTDRWWSKATE